MSSHSFSTWHSTSPISKLNSDVLLEIFAMNTDIDYGRAFSRYDLHDKGRNLIPLTITRRSSQVCQAWRDILLGSASIWASCVNLDALEQKDDWWRNLVLQRTGQALLAVTGLKPPYEPRPDEKRFSCFWQFLIKLMQENWPRIRVLNISESFFRASGSPNLEVIGRPTKNLRVFRIPKDTGDSFHYRDLTLTPRLFSSNAPSLTYLSIGTPYNFFKPFQVALGNLQYLKIFQRQLYAVDFLEACLELPLLREIDIHVQTLVIDEPNFHRLSMEKLAVVLIECPTLDIYTVLDCILPATGCRLHVTHDFNFNRHTHLPEVVHHQWGLTGLQRIMERYTKSFTSSRNHDNSALDFIPKMCDLQVYRDQCTFIGNNDFLSIRLKHVHDRQSSEVAAELANTISTSKLSDALNRVVLQLIPSFIRFLSCDNILEPFLRFFPWTTDLVLATSDLSVIREISRHDLLFPSLKILTLFKQHSWSNNNLENLEADIIPFLHQQRVTAPLEVLDLSGIMWRRNQLVLLDGFTGLKVIWMEYSDTYEYMCGSREGEGWDLLNINAVFPSPSELDAALAAW